MILQRLNKELRTNYVNFKGWRSPKKIVVFESDDWGSIRMASAQAYEELLKKGAPVSGSYFTKYDALESEKDLTDLFEVLTSFKDHSGARPSITANAVVTNPDFDKIKASDFKEYHYELFTETYKKYPQHANSFQIWKQGLGEKLLWPQFHGREHLNVAEWMNVQKKNDSVEHTAFENKTLLGLPNAAVSNRTNAYMSAFEYETAEELNSQHAILKDGLKIFRDIFGFSPKSFVPPCGIMGEEINETLFKEGILYYQTGRYFNPAGNGQLKMINKFWGDKNNLGQLYWRRNCTFEPSKNPTADWVSSCMKEMQTAFRWGKPAVINTHRVNFTGVIDPKNRENTLRMLKALLTQILHKWPDVTFMTSDQLGDFITANSK